MATVNLLFGEIGSIRRNSDRTPVLDGSAVSEDILSTGTSKVTTNAAAGGGVEQFVQITVIGNNIRLAFGISPVALNNSGPLILANQTRDLAISPGFKVAVIDSL